MPHEIKLKNPLVVQHWWKIIFFLQIDPPPGGCQDVPGGSSGADDGASSDDAITPLHSPRSPHNNNTSREEDESSAANESDCKSPGSQRWVTLCRFQSSRSISGQRERVLKIAEGDGCIYCFVLFNQGLKEIYNKVVAFVGSLLVVFKKLPQ